MHFPKGFIWTKGKCGQGAHHAASSGVEVTTDKTRWILNWLLGMLELLITAGVLGLFMACYTSFLQTFPVLVISDPRLEKAATTS